MGSRGWTGQRLVIVDQGGGSRGLAIGKQPESIRMEMDERCGKGLRLGSRYSKTYAIGCVRQKKIWKWISNAARDFVLTVDTARKTPWDAYDRRKGGSPARTRSNFCFIVA